MPPLKIRLGDALADRLLTFNVHILQQFGKQIKYALALADETTTADEVEDTITVITRLSEAYGLESGGEEI